MTCRIIIDRDLPSLLTMGEVVTEIEKALRAKSKGTLIAPARLHVDVGGGALVFTVGAETKDQKVMGFRVYNTFQKTAGHHDQVVAVFDHTTGELKGLILGLLLGAMRTGAIGGVAIKYLSRPDSSSLGVLGTGLQARTQLEAAAAVRQFKIVKVFSPTPAHRETFVREMQAKLPLDIQNVGSAEEVVRNAEVLICASNHSQPIFDARWLRPGTHVTSVGPKFKGACEIPLEVVERSARIVTDSLAQAEGYRDPFFLLGTIYGKRMIELHEIVSGQKTGRSSPEDTTLFCSVGLAGTEVTLAQAFLQKAQEQG